ncbi:MAG: hypothetical protein M3511_15005 [Deinococcota bacterium]|nr:hypothetical protein [Deinococcota bacterium]
MDSKRERREKVELHYMNNVDAGENLAESTDDLGEQFMLDHFSEMNQDFRHYDQRIETALNIYAAAWALLLAGVITLYSDTRDSQLILQIAGVPAAILYALGFFTVRRVVNSTISRARRRTAANLAQHYFTLQTPDISPYLVTLGRTPECLKSIFEEPKYRGEKYEVSFPDGIVYFIIVSNSLLMGLALTSFASWSPQTERLLFLYGLVLSTGQKPNTEA